MLVQTLHPVGHPAGAGFEKGNFQFRIKLENAAADDAHDADHLFEGVRGRVNEKGVIEAFGRRRRPARTDMDAHGNAELLGLGVERIKIRMVQVAARLNARQWRRRQSPAL